MPELIGGRYRVASLLGRGGMAVVYEVTDVSTEQRCALKHMLAPAASQRQVDAIALFEREYSTLAQLRHPRIVRVYDYGIDDRCPFYTLELLDGGDLNAKAPVAWQQACGFAMDICSALALVHSRQMVYRDLSPRNVRCTSDGLAKLIDFGAMTPMGPPLDLVGTLPCCAPETVELHPLDGRTDLYALGATLYFTLVGRHAYPARDLSQLRELWRVQPRRPSELVSGIPTALDRLVMSLLSADRAERPASAAEVMERLGAIAKSTNDELLAVSQAYLSTPTLVGRDHAVDNVRKALARAERQRGTSIVLCGSPGVGRTRLLEACVLEARLAGAVVLAADASAAAVSDYGVVRSLCKQLLHALPEVAQEAARASLPVLAWLVPELLEATSGAQAAVFDNAQALALQLQPALRRWLSDVAHDRVVVIATDEFQRVDASSAAFLALVANDLKARSVLLLTSLDAQAQLSAQLGATTNLLTEASHVIALGPLTEGDAERLLGSVFGEQPNVSRVSKQIFRIAAGNPRDTLRLAQQLVDDKVIRYHAGAWLLPEAIDAIALPSSMAEALRRRIATLSEEPRVLAMAMALAPDERLTFDECLALTRSRSPAELAHSLEELVGCDVVLPSATGYQLGRQGWIAALRESVSADVARRANLALSEIFERRGDGFGAAHHLILAGEQQRGLDVFVRACRETEVETNASYAAFVQLLQSLPHDWVARFEKCLALAEAQGRPPIDRYLILTRLTSLAGTAGSACMPQLEKLIAELYKLSGLDLYAGLDPSLAPSERLGRAMQAARQRYEATPESLRVLDPKTALANLARVLAQSLGVLAIRWDRGSWRRLPSLAPFAALSPPLAIVEALNQGLGARFAGHADRCLAIYRRVLAALSAPDGTAPDASHNRHIRLRVLMGVCMIEAGLGCVPDEAQLRDLESDPLYKVGGALTRMLVSAFLGDVNEADRYRRQAKLLQIESATVQLGTGAHVLPELAAYAALDDLTRLKRGLESVRSSADDDSGWTSVVHYARGEYQRIRGDHEAALIDIELALGCIEPGFDRVWVHAAAAHVTVLCELGRLDEALAAARKHLQVADKVELGSPRSYIELPYAIVLAKLGELDEAVAISEQVLARYTALGVRGVYLGIAHETRARVALEAHDKAKFDEHAALALARKRGVRLRGAWPTTAEPDAPDDAGMRAKDTMRSQLQAVFETVWTSAERAQRGLELLVVQSGAQGGLLYRLTDSKPGCCAVAGLASEDPKIDAMVCTYLESQLRDEDETQASGAEETATKLTLPWQGEGSARFMPVLLFHQIKGRVGVSGVVVLQLDESTQLHYPGELASELSRLCYEKGDLTVHLL